MVDQHHLNRRKVTAYIATGDSTLRARSSWSKFGASIFSWPPRLGKLIQSYSHTISSGLILLDMQAAGVRCHDAPRSIARETTMSMVYITATHGLSAFLEIRWSVSGNVTGLKIHAAMAQLAQQRSYDAHSSTSRTYSIRSRGLIQGEHNLSC